MQLHNFALFSALWLCVIVSPILASGQTLGASAPVIDLGYSKYQGLFNASLNVTTFLGMRYAAAPVGDLRWRLPHAPPTVAGIQQAVSQPMQCYQADEGTGLTSPFSETSSSTKRLVKRSTTSSEDCLFLNVYVPGSKITKTNKTSQGLPVIVWIHGGGYSGGSTTFYTGRGEDLVRESGNGVIVVIIQYRLGVFGFLAGSAVKTNGVLNAGLLDQNYALKWVQTNVGTFGGDPERVTIWGESAGAGSVLQHIVAHGGKTNPPLFRAGMTSSTFLPSQYHYNERIPEALYKEVLAQTNCTSASEALTCLRAVPVDILQTVNTGIESASFSGTFSWVPVVDETFIVERPTETLKKGKVNGEVVLSVTNAFEGQLFVNSSLVTNTTEYISQVFPELGLQDVAKAVELYSDQGSILDQDIGIIGEAIFICPTYFLIEAFGNRSYKGEFALPPAKHGDDLGFYFPTVFNGITFNDTYFVKSFVQSFFDVARFLSPNIKFDPTNTMPQWNAWTLTSTEMLFNKTTEGKAVVQPIKTDQNLLKRCSFWRSVGASIGQ